MSDRDRMTVFACAMLALLLAALDQTIVATALPRISADFHRLDDFSAIVTSYLLASTVTMVVYGKLSDLYGRRLLFLVAIGIFLLGSALCGVAQSMSELIAARVLQGLGAGGLSPLAQASLADLFSPRERGRFSAYISGVWAIASIAGPLSGGVLTDLVSWRWIFFLNLPLGVVALFGIWTRMPVTQKRQRHQIDYIGAALLPMAVVPALLLATWGGSRWPWDAPIILILAACAVTCAISFVLVERRAAEPIVPLELFVNPVVVVVFSSGLLTGALFFIVIFDGALFAQGVLGASATRSGLVMLPFMLAWLAGATIVGRRIARTGRYRRYPIIGLAAAGIGFWLLTHLRADSSELNLVAATVVIGVGLGISLPIFLIALQNAVRPGLVGAATATNMLIRTIGGVGGFAAFGVLLTLRLRTELTNHLGAAGRSIDPSRILRHDDTHQLTPRLADGAHGALADALHTVFAAALPLCILSLCVALFLRELPLRTSSGLDALAEAAPGD